MSPTYLPGPPTPPRTLQSWIIKAISLVSTNYQLPLSISQALFGLTMGSKTGQGFSCIHLYKQQFKKNAFRKHRFPLGVLMKLPRYYT